MNEMTVDFLIEYCKNQNFSVKEIELGSMNRLRGATMYRNIPLIYNAALHYESIAVITDDNTRISLSVERGS